MKMLITKLTREALKLGHPKCLRESDSDSVVFSVNGVWGYIYVVPWGLHSLSECVKEANERNSTHKFINANCDRIFFFLEYLNLHNQDVSPNIKMIAMWHWFYTIVNSINKKLKLSALYFRTNIDCFCSILLTKIVPIKATAELLCLQATQLCFVTEWIHIFLINR